MFGEVNEIFDDDGDRPQEAKVSHKDEQYGSQRDSRGSPEELELANGS